MVTVMLSHEVKDFDTWHPLFLSDEGARTAAGFNLKGLYRAADNANAVTAVFEAPSAEAVYGFCD